jgi:hypothetical protein
MKPKMWWRPQEVREAGNMEHPLSKATGHEQSQFKGEATTRKAVGVALPKPLDLTSYHYVSWMQDLEP